MRRAPFSGSAGKGGSMGGFMHLPHSLAALSATLLLAATTPQLTHAREIVGFSDPYSSGTVVVKTNERALTPPRSNRKIPIEYDRETYKRHNLIRRCINRPKQFRRITTRYDCVGVVRTSRLYFIQNCKLVAVTQRRSMRTGQWHGSWSRAANSTMRLRCPTVNGFGGTSSAPPGSRANLAIPASISA